MMTIEIDFDVYKALTSRRADESVSYNDVLRGLLGLGAESAGGIRRLFGLGGARAAAAPSNDWIYKGIRFPAGTELRARYKGVMHRARIERGALILNGKRAGSPSEAARTITGTNVNGWRFWQCRLPGDGSWRRLESLQADS
jgi:Protein of unknown function (DUF2924)